MERKIKSKILEASLDQAHSGVKKTDLNTYFIFGAIFLVLAVGLYALFSPQAQNARLGNPACGKIVIASDGPTLASNVSPSLSEARYFLVVNPLSKKLIEATSNPYLNQPGNPQVAYLVAGKGEEAVIVGNVDQQSYDILMQFGIRVFGGYQGQARKVISLYRQAHIFASPQPTVNTPQNFASGQRAAPMVSPGVQQGMTPAGWGVNSMAMLSNPLMPLGMQSGIMQGALGPQWRNSNLYNQHRGMNANAFCPLPGAGQGGYMLNGMGMNRNPVLGPGVMRAGGMGVMDTGLGMQDIYKKGVMDGMNLNSDIGMGTQVAFGLGQQGFVCPNCNWRMKAARQGNAFPNCPNCASVMALDMASAKNFGQWLTDGKWAADMTQLQGQFNQSLNQPNFWQGPESLGFFLCPNCNWRMYAQQGANEFPRCPNCSQIMARGGAYPANQYAPNNQGYSNMGAMGAMGTMGATGAAQVAAQTPGPAPVIFRDAVMPHEYRGVCENCHIVRADIPIQATALMPHPYRGVCSNCHQILGTQAGAQSYQNVNPNAFDPNTMPQYPDTARVVIGPGQGQ